LLVFQWKNLLYFFQNNQCSLVNVTPCYDLQRQWCILEYLWFIYSSNASLETRYKMTDQRRLTTSGGINIVFTPWFSWAIFGVQDRINPKTGGEYGSWIINKIPCRSIPNKCVFFSNQSVIIGTSSLPPIFRRLQSLSGTGQWWTQYGIHFL